MFKLKVEFPTAPDLVEIIDRTTAPHVPAASVVATKNEVRQMVALAREVEVASHVKGYVARVTKATHAGPSGSTLAARYVRYGGSPRGAQAMILSSKVRALVRSEERRVGKECRL